MERPTPATSCEIKPTGRMTAPIIERLTALKPDSRPLTAEHKARCPAHEDRVESLTWTIGDDGRVLVNCHAGCTAEAIVAALDAEMKDLFEPKQRSQPRVVSVDEHHVRDVDGHVVAVHLRPHLSDGTKGPMTWRQPDGSAGLNGTPQSALPLYGSHLDLKSSVVLVEGEKCAEALWGVGVSALATFGASHTPDAAVIELLRGRTVALWPDNDEPGRRHMSDMAQRLAGVASESSHPRPVTRHSSSPCPGRCEKSATESQ